MAELDQITVATRRYIRETPKLVDNVFQHDPLWAYARQNVREDYDGGRLIEENFYYDGLNGGPYAKGKQFNISQKQIEQGGQFLPKFFEVDVTLYKEDIQVINRGEAAAFRLIESRVNAAYMTIGAHLAIAQYLNGQAANYTANFNGAAEAINDGTNAGWDGATYPTYGTITRGGAVGKALNSVPTNVGGTIEYNTLEETYANASFGDGEFEPNIGVTTFKGYSYVKEKFQTQQRFNNIQDPKIGFTGLQFNNAVLMRSRYCPGTYISGTGDLNAVTFFTEMTNGALTAYPTVTSETLWWFNARKPFYNLYITTDEEFGLGFSGFKPAQGNTVVAGQVLYAGAVTWAPRYHQQLFGITG